MHKKEINKLEDYEWDMYFQEEWLGRVDKLIILKV